MSTDTLTWDWREQPDLDALAGILAKHGVRLEQVDTGRDDYEVRVSSASPVLVYPQRRREWAAALRWEADQAHESVERWERTDLRQADSAAWCASVCYIDAHRIESGELTPWADTPVPAPTPPPGPELSAALQAEAPEPRLSGPDLRQAPDQATEAQRLSTGQHLASCVWVDPGRMSGAPCLGGTRITVDTIAGLVAEGLDGDQIRGLYPDVTDEHLTAVRHFVAEVDGSDAVEAARRDAAADALEWAARHSFRMHGSDLRQVAATREDLNDWAAEVRDGTRTVPGQPEPA